MSLPSIFSFGPRLSKEKRRFGQFVQDELVARFVRRDMLPRPLHDETCWCIMLELYLADLRRQPAMTKDLVLAAGLSDASVLRAIDKLVESKLMTREKDQHDARITRNLLSDFGRQVMEVYLSFLQSFDEEPSSFRDTIVQGIVETLKKKPFVSEEEDTSLKYAWHRAGMEVDW